MSETQTSSVTKGLGQKITKDFGEPTQGKRPGQLITINIRTTAIEEKTSINGMRRNGYEL